MKNREISVKAGLLVQLKLSFVNHTACLVELIGVNSNSFH